MKTTIKQQIEAVQRARQEFENMEWGELDDSLNDAASTLAAVNMIGVKKVELIPQMMEAIQLAVFLSPQSNVLQELNDKLKQL